MQRSLNTSDIFERLTKITQATPEEHVNFWTDKAACWEMCHCPAIIREECPATRYQMVPCWEIEGTYCKLDDYGQTGTDTSICQVCRVYKKYGNGRPIELKLMGRGIDRSLKSLEKKAKE